MMRSVVATVLLGGGVLFIIIASIGVARLPDAFQRMHASTKAGGIGTTLVLLGAMVAGNVASPVTGLFAVLFMLFTLSVASQLLARAAYMSGAELHGVEADDPLREVLDREAGPAENAAERDDVMRHASAEG